MLAVERYALARRGEVARLAETLGLLHDTAPFGGQWRAALDGATSAFMSILVARQDGRPCGIAAISRRPTGISGRLVTVDVAPAQRRSGVGSALLRETGHELAQAGIARQIAPAWGGRSDVVAFLAANGFRLYEKAYTMMCQEAPPAAEPGDIPCTLYEGGDEALDQQIADLFNVAFRGDAIAGPVSGEDLRHVIDGYDAWFLIARDPATDRLVGTVECHANGYFCSLAVARKFWGTGLSRRLACTAFDRYKALGRHQYFALIRTTNAASLRLAESLSWRRQGEMTFYAAETLP